MYNLKPNSAEQAFLSLGYNRFLDLFKEIESKEFWEQSPAYRFHRIRDIFAIYTELIRYEPLEHVLLTKKVSRPVEHDLGERLFSFVRHLLAHFPLFNSWDAVTIDQQLATWERKGQIHKFLIDFEGKPQVKYRFYDSAAKEMIYVQINFPADYSRNKPVQLRAILTEREGVRFSIRLMLNILLHSVENAEDILSELRAQ
jgi:hypothetical protein